MDYQENLINVLARDIVEDYVDLHGIDCGIDLYNIDKDKLLALAIKIAEKDRDFLDCMAEDKYQEIQAAVFSLIQFELNVNQEIERKNCIKNHILSYYRKRIEALLFDRYIHVNTEMHLSLGHKSTISEQTGEAQWR
jgi:hypothetical protein